jgi:hypothetical protein
MHAWGERGPARSNQRSTNWLSKKAAASSCVGGHAMAFYGAKAHVNGVGDRPGLGFRALRFEMTGRVPLPSMQFGPLFDLLLTFSFLPIVRLGWRSWKFF